MTSVPWRAFGANWASYVLLGGAMSFIGCLVLSRIAERNFGVHAKLPALLFALVYLNFNFAVFGGFQLETIQTFFAILAAGAAMEWMREADWRRRLCGDVQTNRPRAAGGVGDRGTVRTEIGSQKYFRFHRAARGPRIAAERCADLSRSYRHAARHAGIV